jgi:pyridoxal phosphate enzyme (YggS family)
MKKICQNIKLIQNDLNRLTNHRKIKLIAVTKTFSYQDVLLALECGVKHIGESKVQEALPKFLQLGSALNGIMKHFIGNIQSNKVRKIVAHFDLIHSLDSVAIANLIGKHAKMLGKVQQCLIEVKMQKTEVRAGIDMSYVKDFYKYCLTIPHLLIKGLMVIAPCNSSICESRKCFKKVYNLFQDLNISFRHSAFNVLSMGMSNDYKIAVEEGATMVRIGSAIFGQR